MSDPVAPVPGQPYGQPPAAPYGQPPAPPKKKRTGKIILIILGVLVVVCAGLGVGVYFFANKAVDIAYAEGNCIDTLPGGDVAQQAVPAPVPCTDSRAKAKILKVADNQQASDANAICGNVPGATSFVLIVAKSKLLCLGPK